MAPATSARDLLFCSFLLVVVNTIFGGWPALLLVSLVRGFTLSGRAAVAGRRPNVISAARAGSGARRMTRAPRLRRGWRCG